MVWVLGVHQQRHLVGAEGALDLQAVDHFWSRPALGRAQHDHRPAGRARSPFFRALPWISRMLSIPASKAAAIAWCITSGSSPSTKYGAQPQPRMNWSSSSCSMRAKTVGLLIL